TESPFADDTGLISGLLQYFRNGESPFRKWHLTTFFVIGKAPQFVIPPYERVSAVSSGQQHTARGGADRSTGVMFGKANSFGCQLIQMRGFYLFLPIYP